MIASGNDSIHHAHPVDPEETKAMNAETLIRENAYQSFLLARGSADADVDACQKQVCDSGNLIVLRRFAREIPGANIPMLRRRAEQMGKESLDYFDEVEDKPKHKRRKGILDRLFGL